MRLFLVLAGILSWSAGLSAYIILVVRSGTPRYDILLILCAAIIVNTLCATYLFKNAPTKKIDWMLFGFTFNLTAVIAFHVYMQLGNRN